MRGSAWAQDYCSVIECRCSAVGPQTCPEDIHIIIISVHMHDYIHRSALHMHRICQGARSDHGTSSTNLRKLPAIS